MQDQQENGKSPEPIISLFFDRKTGGVSLQLHEGEFPVKDPGLVWDTVLMVLGSATRTAERSLEMAYVAGLQAQAQRQIQLQQAAMQQQANIDRMNRKRGGPA